MDSLERQTDFDSGQADMLQALRSASLPDEFWMYSYKILPCPHGYRHSWTHCPFSHAGETARRRCPRTHNYLPDPCVNARAKRQCPNGDACPYAHNTFEQWLHPARYRTRLCYLGANCRRPTCFFAHSVEELRSVDENETGTSAPQPPTGSPMPLPSLPMPPPLPAPPSSSTSVSSAPANDFGSLQAISQTNATAAPTPPPSNGVALPGAAGGGAPAGAAPMPMGLFQPIALVCMPPNATQMAPGTHAVMRPDLMAAAGGPAGYVTFQARPGLPRLPAPGGDPSSSGQPPMQPRPTAMPVPMAVSVPMPHQALMPMAMRPQARPPHGHVGQTVAVAAVHGGQIHMTPAGPMYFHTGIPAGAPMHVAPPPPPPPHGYTAVPPYGVASGYGSGAGEGRPRSWSNPGESPFVAAAAPAYTATPGQHHMYGSVLGSGSGSASGGSERMPPTSPGWPSDPGRSTRATAGLAPSVTAIPASALSGPSSPPHLARGANAPRHMPAPTNRGAAVRRLSTPASLPASVASAAAAAAAATAAVAAMRYPDVDPSGARTAGGTLPSSGSSGANGTGAALSPSAARGGEKQSQPQLEAAMQSMMLTSKSVTAPPPTPSAASLPGGGSPYSASLASSPLAVMPVAAHASIDSEAAAAVLNGAASKTAAFSTAAMRTSMDGVGGGSAAAATYSRPSSSGSSQGSGSRAAAGAFDANAAAAAAALAAAAAVAAGAGDPQSPSADAVASVAAPYRALLQHVLRSASASAAEPPHVLLPALLGGAASAANLTDADLALYDDADEPERSSDPGPSGLRAAIRRISTELGSAAVSRNSDPGQTVPGAAAADVQQLLLPLLQTVLTEGLATGQFELVNGQLQVKGSPSGVAGGLAASGGSGSGYVAVSAPAGPEGAAVPVSPSASMGASCGVMHVA